MSSDPIPDPEPADDESPCAYTDYVEGEVVEEYPKTGEGAEGLEADVWDVLHDVDDPEMPISIVDLGLIYGVDADESTGAVRVEMTLTYTGCPARKYLTEEIEERIGGVEGVESVDLDLVWDPPWTLELVTENGKEQLQEFGLSI